MMRETAEQSIRALGRETAARTDRLGQELSDAVSSNLLQSAPLAELTRERARNAFPPSLSRTWGEASWTSPDLWLGQPVLAALRESAIISGLAVAEQLDAWQAQSYRRLRQSVEELKARAAFAPEEAAAPPEEPALEGQEPVEETPTPTDAMLALGTQVTRWTARLVVVTFVVILIGLGFELRIADAIPFP